MLGCDTRYTVIVTLVIIRKPTTINLVTTDLCHLPHHHQNQCLAKLATGPANAHTGNTTARCKPASTATVAVILTPQN